MEPYLDYRYAVKGSGDASEGWQSRRLLHYLPNETKGINILDARNPLVPHCPSAGMTLPDGTSGHVHFRVQYFTLSTYRSFLMDERVYPIAVDYAAIVPHNS